MYAGLITLHRTETCLEESAAAVFDSHDPSSCELKYVHKLLLK